MHMRLKTDHQCWQYQEAPGHIVALPSYVMEFKIGNMMKGQPYPPLLFSILEHPPFEHKLGSSSLDRLLLGVARGRKVSRENN